MKFLIIFLFLLIIIVKKVYLNENFFSLLNIYNQPLLPCKEKNMFNGSWDEKGKCSELDGGIHQICIKNISKNTQNFSLNTGQSDWSNKRSDNNHCVCLGAWALYNAKNKTKKNILKCEAIPSISLSKKYVSKFSEGWNKWNGIEIDNQIKNGVESLFENCYDYNNPNSEKSINLRNNYCKFANDILTLKKSNLYQKIC